jgi:UPF0755 protein
VKGAAAVRLGAAIGLAVAACALAAAAWSSVWRTLHVPYAGWEGPQTIVLLEPGLDAGSVLRKLADAGVLRRPRVVRAWLALRGRSGRLHAGEYRFSEPATAVEVVRRLERGDVLLHEVTIREGLVLDETAARFAEAGFGPVGALLAAFRDPAPIAEIDPHATDLEGYLFPETYRFPRGERPERIVAAMVRQFRDATGGDYAKRAAALGLDVRAAVILASLIEMETPVAAERSRIARVFHNRLARGMKLECDATVRYALRRAGRPAVPLTYEDLRFDSPWNTYRAGGLPPGPIASPGRESLLAAVSPQAGADLYFVAAPGGGHRFSTSLAAHLRAVAEWRAYSRSSASR